MSIITTVLNFVVNVNGSGLNIPKAQANDAQFQAILASVFAFAGIMAVIFIIIGGIRYTISQGNAGELEKAKNIIVYALVGLVFVITGFTIVQFITAWLF